MRLRNRSTGAIIATRVVWGQGAWRRLVGLLFREEVTPDEGIWFPTCAAIHLVGMRVPLDVIFLDEHARVLRTQLRVPRHHVVRCCGASSTIELGAGALSRAEVRIGDRLVLEDAAPQP